MDWPADVTDPIIMFDFSEVGPDVRLGTHWECRMRSAADFEMNYDIKPDKSNASVTSELLKCPRKAFLRLVSVATDRLQHWRRRIQVIIGVR